MRLLIGFIAFFAINHHVLLVHGNTEVDVNLMPATQDQQHIAALTNNDGNFFNTDGMVENFDVESVPISNGGNVSIGNGHHAAKFEYGDDGDGYSAPIESSYPQYGNTNNYDEGKYIKNIFSKKK